MGYYLWLARYLWNQKVSARLRWRRLQRQQTAKYRRDAYERERARKDGR